MKYCKNCGAELEDTDNFCEKCGTKFKAKSPSKKSIKSQNHSDISVSPSNKHVLPAILSFFIPALGQFVKGQVKWGLTIWLWFILGNLLIGALAGLFGWFSIMLFIVFNLFMWVYQIHDAYNAPEIEPKEE
ncbi:zinc ribbon domain-containing protein [Candidatus Woesearchaeota archaeon]|nr:zinc ribbon domain-containing protein [Candidatus Woesearchaeota archaeon]